jgi:hypothetical protein
LHRIKPWDESTFTSASVATLASFLALKFYPTRYRYPIADGRSINVIHLHLLSSRKKEETAVTIDRRRQAGIHSIDIQPLPMSSFCGTVYRTTVRYGAVPRLVEVTQAPENSER